MLSQLRIRNFALIDEVELEFGGGFNVLTGETGAGKSILIDAITAVLGGRAGPEWLRTGAERATIEAIFELPLLVESPGTCVAGGLRAESADGDEPGADPQSLSTLATHSLGTRPATRVPELSTFIEDGLLILSRELTRAGKSLCRINGRTVTAGALREVAGGLIDLYGQHDHQSLLAPERHVDLLDEWAGATVLGLRRRAVEAYTGWQEVRRERERLHQNERDRARQLDLYQFQIDEIDSAQITPGEEEELAAERLRLASAEKLYGVSTAALQSLSEGSVDAVDLLSAAAREVESASALDAGLAPIVDLLQTAVIAAQDAVSELRAYQEAIEFNPERLEQVQDRLDLLRRLKKKYGDTLEEVVEYRERISAELNVLVHSEERIAELGAELERRGVAMDRLATELHAARRAAAAEFERRLVAELADLNMAQTRFEVQIDPPLPSTEVGSEGISRWLGRVEFMISPNPGEPVRPLARIASGGEMSRIMLALKSAIAGVNAVPTLIFDEIDVGVGGRTAEVLGQKMAALAGASQVLCVTHLPQIAGMASRHFRVEKRVENHRTMVEVRPLEAGERVEELARMLGGKAETAERHARELLASSPTPSPQPSAPTPPSAPRPAKAARRA